MRLFRKTQADVARLLYSCANFLLEMMRKVLWLRGRPAVARRVCVYRIGNIGDIVCAIPALYAIRRAYPDSRLTLLTSPGKTGMPGARELLQGADWLDEMIVYYARDLSSPGKRWAWLRDLRKRGFDIWIELPNGCTTFRVALRNMLAARWVGAKWGYGWRISTIRWAARAQSEHIQFPNEVERLLAVVAEAGINPTSPVFPLPLQGGHSRAAENLLSEHGLLDVPLVALAPGAKRSTNRWPAERFAEVGRYLVSKGFGVIVLGGEPHVELCEQVAEKIGPGGISLARQTSLLEDCALLKRCRLLVSNDSGCQHLAAAVGTPCLSLFSFRDLRGTWWPYGSGNTVLQKWVECHTCFLETCPYDNRCIKLIDVNEVIAWVNKKIGERTQPPLLDRRSRQGTNA